MSAMWKVYMVRCSDGSLYTGITTDIKRRLKEHNNKKGSRITRTKTPVKLVYSQVCKNRSEALQRECAIKSLPRDKKLLLIRKR